MKLTLQLRVLPTPDQKATLLATMERFNEAANLAARIGFEAGVFSQPSIHSRCYAAIRERFGLSAQMAVRAIGKAVEAFATLKAKGRKECPTFKPRGAVTYDQRILSFKGLDKVSLWALGGRMIVPLIHGEYQGQRFDRMKGQVDLVYRGGKFFLYATVDVPEDAPIEPKDFLGVDLGIVNLAADSDGTTYSGEDVERVRRRHHRNRKRGQSKGTRGAKKRLKRLARREANFRRHVNHCISKTIVSRAKDTGRGIVLEDLKGIRDRTTVRARDRAKHLGWSFFQLRSFVEYKAALVGVPVVTVDPRNTSRTCSVCGYCDKANRKTRDSFLCLHCGYSAMADLNAALNLRIQGLGRSKAASELAAGVDGSTSETVSRKAAGL
jgi:IS605 OrfB family transposase